VINYCPSKHSLSIVQEDLLADNIPFSCLCIVERPRAGQSLFTFWLVGMQAMELRCYDLIDCG
jgi:hypothetical protein